MIMSELLDALERKFAELSAGLDPWPYPREPFASPREEEYSRVSDPEKYRLLKARVDAWAEVLREVADEVAVDSSQLPWSQPGVWLASAATYRPHQAGAVPLTLARIRIGETEAAYGVAIAVGHPAQSWSIVPGCGCDACDDGWLPLMEQLDNEIVTVLLGGTLLVTDGTTTVRRTREGWGASSSGEMGDVSGWLDQAEQPEGRTVVRGTAWV